MTSHHPCLTIENSVGLGEAASRFSSFPLKP